MSTDNDMAIGGHYKYLPKADIKTLNYILDHKNRYETRFCWEAAAELARREQAGKANIASALGLTSVANHIDPSGEARIAELAAENERLRRLLAECVDALKRVEYVTTGVYWMCTVCGSDAARYSSKRHTTDCPIAAAIEAAKGVAE